MNEENKKWIDVLNNLIKEYPDLDIMFTGESYGDSDVIYLLGHIKEIKISDLWKPKYDDNSLYLGDETYIYYDDVKDNVMSCDYDIKKEDVGRVIKENYNHKKVILVELGE